jgi:hypothetical protein
MKIVNGVQVYEYEFTDAQILVIQRGIAKVPLEEALDTWNSVQRQIASHREAMAPAKTSKEPLPPLPEGADYHRFHNGMPNLNGQS